ncbi:UNVERIFIED_CONTAM: hypothetical protein LK11_02620 [Mumia flava]
MGLLGHGVTASLTPALHRLEADRQGLRYVYRPVEMPAQAPTGDALKGLLDSARVLGFDALNVTHPLKRAVVAHLDELEPATRRLNAVNTVLIQDGRLVGHNTDLTGFTTAVREHLTADPLGHVLVVGAGGAGSAVAEAAAGLGASPLVVVDAEDRRAQDLAADLSARHPGVDVRPASYADLPDALRDADGIVHCTPTGMAHHPGVPFDVDLLEPSQWVADIVYRPLETELLVRARERGCQVLHGGYMAVYQASHTFTLVTGRVPDHRLMLGDLDELVARSAP